MKTKYTKSKQIKQTEQKQRNYHQDKRSSETTVPETTPEQQTTGSQQYTYDRNYLACEQCILIALLNKHCEIRLQRARKRSNTTIPFFTIESIKFGPNDIVYLNSYIEKRCKQIYEYDISSGVTEKTAKRRYKTNRNNEVIHALIDFLRIKGEQIETVLTRQKLGVIQRETLIGCSLDGNWVCKSNIYDFGRNINATLQERMDYDFGIVLEQNSFSFV